MKLTDLELMIHHETAKAVLVSDDGEREHAVWLPKSQIEFEEPVVIGKAQIVTLPEQLATAKGLV
jgi:hypothetical protein